MLVDMTPGPEALRAPGAQASPPPHRPSGVSAGLSVDDILDTAIAHIESEGYETLTMRKLATTLTVTPMSIYRHVANKNDLLSLVADRYFSELAVPADTSDWQIYLREWFAGLHQLMLAHPVLAHVMAEQPLDGPVAWKAAEHLIDVMVGHGFDPHDAGDLFTTLLTYTIGFTLVRLGRSPGVDSPAARPTEDLRSRYPHLASGLTHYADWLSTPSFERGIRTFIRAWELR
jgi:AcrR family transcriptional regulator